MSDIDITQASIIGVMILFPDRVSEVERSVSELWFTGDYRKAFNHLVKTGGSDPASLAAGIGVSIETVNSWTDLEFSAAYLNQHIGNLETEAGIRRIRYLGKQLLQVTDQEEALKLIDRFDNSASGMDLTAPVSIKRGLSKLMVEIERRSALKGQILGMTYGIDDLDEKTEGMHKGDLVVVAAPPSSGKTAFAIAASEAAAEAGAKVLIFSCEMTVEQLLMRSLAGHSGVPLGAIRSARLRDCDCSRLTDSMAAMSGWNVQIDDPAGITFSELARKTRKAAKEGLDLVVIDYLQIMKYDASKENQELGAITTALKNLAKELKICIMLLSQLNRGSEKEKRRPTMSDLRGSGMIENNADVILFPYREAANCQLCQEGTITEDHDPKVHQSKAEIIIGKQRQGERNISVKVVWIGDRTRFVGLAKGVTMNNA